MKTKETEVSIGLKIGVVAIVIFFAALGGFFGFLFYLVLQLSGIHDPTVRLTSIIVGAVLFSLIPLISLKRGAKKERERIESSGGDSSGVDIFSLAIIGSMWDGSGSSSGSDGGWFSGGGDSGGGGGGGGE